MRIALLRWAFAVATGLVIVAGHAMVVEASTARDYDVVFVLWITVALFPVAMYAVVARGRATTLVCGSLLLAVTACSWVFVWQSTNDFALLAPGLAFFVATGISTLAGLAGLPSLPPGHPPGERVRSVGRSVRQGATLHQDHGLLGAHPGVEGGREHLVRGVLDGE